MLIWDLDLGLEKKKFNRSLFPNRVKLWPITSDLVFVCLKVFENKIWANSEPLPQPPLGDLKNNDPKIFFFALRVWEMAFVYFFAFKANDRSSCGIHFRLLRSRALLGFPLLSQDLVINCREMWPNRDKKSFVCFDFGLNCQTYMASRKYRNFGAVKWPVLFRH